MACTHWNIAPENQFLGRWNSFWGDLFSEAMLVFWGVSNLHIIFPYISKDTHRALQLKTVVGWYLYRIQGVRKKRQRHHWISRINSQVFFWCQNNQLIVNWWLEARWFGILWGTHIPLSNNPFHKEIPNIQTTGPQTTDLPLAETTFLRALDPRYHLFQSDGRRNWRFNVPWTFGVCYCGPYVTVGNEGDFFLIPY